MRGFAFDVACLCGGELVYTNGASQSSCEACASVTCTKCGHSYGVHVYLSRIKESRLSA